MTVVSEGARAEFQYERIPPQNIDAEISVLGSMLLSKDAIGDVVETITDKDFYKPIHADIFRAIVKLYGKGVPADPLSLAHELERNGDLERIGGRLYLDTLVSSISTPANAVYYAEIVREQAQLRALVEVGTRITQLGYTTNGADVEQLVDTAQAEVFAISEQHEASSFRPLGDIIPDLINELETNASRDDSLRGVPTGFKDLDNKLNGLREGQMIIIAARPGAGKSTLAMDIARTAAIKNDMPTVYFSLEMNRNELAMRLLAAETDIFLDRMIKGKIEDRDWTKIASTLERIGQKPLIIDDSPNITTSEIRAKCRRLKQQHDIKLVIIDYLQLMSSSGRRVAENRQQEVSEQSRAIKLLAKELGVPIITVAQLNRNAETREGKRPQVSDLRESGSLEQDADVILLIHRPDVYRPEEERDGSAEIIIGKQRSGPTGTVDLLFRGNVSSFGQYAEQDQQGELS
ncbi:MAG: replicative DNA helicase [Actinomycetaceae bacterium]|nr:replicative DNA helicase [Actinomycetaceae bacterium]